MHMKLYLVIDGIVYNVFPDLLILCVEYKIYIIHATGSQTRISEYGYILATNVHISIHYLKQNN